MNQPTVPKNLSCACCANATGSNANSVRLPALRDDFDPGSSDLDFCVDFQTTTHNHAERYLGLLQQFAEELIF